MLPKAVLKPPSRGGKNVKKRNDAETKWLCLTWLEGHQGSLSNPAQQAKARARLASQQQESERGSVLVKDYLLQKACEALSNDPPTVVTNAIVEEIEEQIPQARDLDRTRMSVLW